MTKKLTSTSRLRRDIQTIAADNMKGKSLDSIAKKYKCSRFLVIRVMRELLPEDFWVDRARQKARVGKAKAMREPALVK